MWLKLSGQDIFSQKVNVERRYLFQQSPENNTQAITSMIDLEFWSHGFLPFPYMLTAVLHSNPERQVVPKSQRKKLG